MVLLLARLAHHLLLWGKQGLSRVPATRRRLQGYGLVRLLRDVWAVPGVIRWRRGWMVSVRFALSANLLHGLDVLFCQTRDQLLCGVATPQKAMTAPEGNSRQM